MEIAKRYRDEPCVAGFDLLNEPLPERTGATAKYKHLVEPLYRRITQAIRQVDQRHMIILEGVDWANDWSIFTEPFDANLVYQFHFYCWDNPTPLKGIDRYLKHRERLQVPDSVFPHFDYINIMAYDGAGPWAPQSPGQHSSYAYATNNVAYWVNRGLAKAKAVLGVPFYGYGFGAAFRKRDYAYRAILTEYPGAEKFDQAGNTIWYNGIPTIKAKSRYVVAQQLGGVMIWSLDYVCCRG